MDVVADGTQPLEGALFSLFYSQKISLRSEPLHSSEVWEGLRIVEIKEDTSPGLGSLTSQSKHSEHSFKKGIVIHVRANISWKVQNLITRLMIRPDSIAWMQLHQAAVCGGAPHALDLFAELGSLDHF